MGQKHRTLTKLGKYERGRSCASVSRFRDARRRYYPSGLASRLPDYRVLGQCLTGKIYRDLALQCKDLFWILEDYIGNRYSIFCSSPNCGLESGDDHDDNSSSSDIVLILSLSLTV